MLCEGKLAGWNAIGAGHPIVCEGLGRRAERNDVLHPIGAGPSGHDEPRGEAVEMRQRRAIHLISDENIVIHRFPERNALDELRRLVENGTVSSVQYDLDRLL